MFVWEQILDFFRNKLLPASFVIWFYFFKEINTLNKENIVGTLFLDFTFFSSLSLLSL